MSDDGYQGGATVGDRVGCAIAAILGLPLFFFLLIGDALGDCAPDVPCRKGFLLYFALPTAIISLAVGLGVRALVNRWKRNGS